MTFWVKHAIGLVLSFALGCTFLLLLVGLAEARGVGGLFVFPLVAPVAILAIFGMEFWRHSRTDRADYRLTLYSAAFSTPAILTIGAFFAGMLGPW